MDENRECRPNYRLVVGIMVLLVSTNAVLVWQFFKQRSQSIGSITSKQTTLQSTQSTNQSHSGLLEHDTYVAFSKDPTNFPEGMLIAEGTSVPDIVKIGNELRIYFVNAATTHHEGDIENLAFVASQNGGQTWSERQLITIINKPDEIAPVDPSIVTLLDGRIRLYFYNFSARVSQSQSNQSPRGVIYSAISTDGVQFTLEEGERFFEEGGLTDPEVVYWNNRWYMYFVAHGVSGQGSGPRFGLATSSDGLTFERQGYVDAEFSGIPGVLPTEQGIRLYGCGQGTIPSGLAEANNLTITFDRPNILSSTPKGIVCDPAIISVDNQYVLVYKRAPGN